MNKHLFCSLSLLLILTQACSDAVPSIAELATESQPSVFFNNPPPVNPCSSPVIYRLAKEDGTFAVDYCGQLPCYGIQPDWGVVTTYNGELPDLTEVRVFEFQLAMGWFCTEIDYQADFTSNFLLDGNGLPTLGSTWADSSFLPPAPSLEVHCPLTGLPQCNTVSARLRLFRQDFYGGIDVNSETIVWLRNENWNNPAMPSANSLAPELLPICAISCPNSAIDRGEKIFY